MPFLPAREPLIETEDSPAGSQPARLNSPFINMTPVTSMSFEGV